VAVTIGVGMASRENQMPDAEALVRAADRALRAAKKAGQDRIGITERGQARSAGR
jgi:GGDEF domain-containing protein